jgi:type IV pilus assembly protein PilN
MIRINLLPHREEKRKARRQQFFVLMGLVAVLAGLIAFLGYSIISGYITTQEERNAFLKTEIAILDKQLEEIKRLKEQTASLLSRKQIIESLQSDRAEAVFLLNEMVKQMPEGVYLRALKQDGRKVSLNGYTQSNARISTLMRNLEASPVLEKPELIEIKAVSLDKKRVSEFSMTVTLSRAPVSADEKLGVTAGGGKK